MKYIFIINYQILNQYLHEMQDPQYILRISDDPFSLEKERRILTCYFYNFLVAAKSLIEHIEKYIRKSKSEIDKSLYVERLILIQNKVKEFNDSKEGHFIRQFRNYIIHEGLPLLNTSIKFPFNKTSENKMETIHMIEKNKLEKDKAFKNKGKEYLDSLGKKINIKLISKLFYKKNISIYNFFEFERMKNQIDEIYKIGYLLDKDGNKIEKPT
jgi:hypothetical protein